MGKGVQKCVFCWEVVSFLEGPFIGGSPVFLIGDDEGGVEEALARDILNDREII